MNIDVVAEAIRSADPFSLHHNQQSNRYLDDYRKMAEAAIESIFSEVTRVGVVKPAGRTTFMSTEHWADSWEPSLQDKGRTLKLFAKGSGHEAECERDKSLAADLCSAADLTVVRPE